eukprot:1127754-Prorocentrum_lima.AAC.1
MMLTGWLRSFMRVLPKGRSRPRMGRVGMGALLLLARLVGSMCDSPATPDGSGWQDGWIGRPSAYAPH